MPENQKNYGCLAGIVVLLLGYVVLSIFVHFTNFLGKLLENPFINYGIPVFLLFLLYLKTEKDKKDKGDSEK